MDRFLLSENPMIEPDKRRIYIFHTQQPSMLIEVHHEAIAFGDGKMFTTGHYQGPEGIIETITLEVSTLLTRDPEITEALKNKVEKVLSKAWYWYAAYLKWEDSQDHDDYSNTKYIDEN